MGWVRKELKRRKKSVDFIKHFKAPRIISVPPGIIHLYKRKSQGVTKRELLPHPPLQTQKALGQKKKPSVIRSTDKQG